MPYLTGDEIPSETVCKVVRIPDDPALIRAFRGALLELTYSHNWEQYGSITPDEAAQAFLDAFWTFEEDDCETPGMIIGEIRFFGLVTAPEGWLECNGDSISQATYPDLFAAIGENFGFAVGGNFRLPDLRFRVPMGTGELGGSSPYEVGLGQQAGQEEIALTTDYIPSHNHSVTDPGHNHPPASGQNTFLGNGTGSNTAPAGSGLNTRTTTGTATTGITIGNTGGGLPFPIIQPGIGLLACIYAGV